MLEVAAVCIKLIWIIFLSIVLCIAIFMTGSEKPKSRVVMSISELLNLLGISDPNANKARIAELTASFLSTLAIPFIVLTTFLSIPGDILAVPQGIIKSNFWYIIIISELGIWTYNNNIRIDEIAKQFAIPKILVTFVSIFIVLISITFSYAIYILTSTNISSNNNTDLHRNITGIIFIIWPSLIFLGLYLFCRRNFNSDISATIVIISSGIIIYLQKYTIILLALFGNIESQTLAGISYQFGVNFFQSNQQEAARFYKLAADQGSPIGRFQLALFLENGKGGLAKDEASAVHYYEGLAEEGNADGQFALGLAYQAGQGGIVKDERRAVQLYQKAADQGKPTAQFALELAYRSGIGVTEDAGMAEYFDALTYAHKDISELDREELQKFVDAIGLIGVRSWPVE